MPTGEVKWVKFGNIKNIAFLGKEVIAISSGIHVVFINLNTKEEKVEKFNSNLRGEGASCLTGHPVVPMFALAERCTRPSISIFTYPAIDKISTCIYEPDEKKQRSHFLSSIFGGTDYLLTLISYPDFKLIVWLWRTGESLKIIDTNITDDTQHITCSVTASLSMVQLGEESGNMTVYEMSVCSKIILLTPMVVLSTEKIQSVSWTYDGNLLLCDELGNVYFMQSDGKRRYLVVKSNIPVKPQWRTLIADFRGGVAVVNSESHILFYRKSSGERLKHGNLWKFIWEVKTISHPVYMIRHPQRDSLLFYTSTGEIAEISVGDDDVPRMQMICTQGCGYVFLMTINPHGINVALLDGFNRLIIIESNTGSISSVLSLDKYGIILSSLAHPALPIIVTCTAIGRCNIVNVIDALKPVLIKSLFLIKQPLDKMKFSWDEKMLGIVNKSEGFLFILNGFDKLVIKVHTFIKFYRQIVDFLIYEDNSGSLKILILLKTHSTIYIGKYIVIYNIKNNNPEVESVIELPNIFKDLHYWQNPFEIIASPYLTKQIHIMNIDNDSKSVRLTECISSSHRLREINMNISAEFLLTFNYDGLVIIRKKSNINQIFIMTLTHHRQEGGIKSVVLSVQQNNIISLGKNGNLVANQTTSLLAGGSGFTDLDTDSSNLETLEILSSFIGKLDDEVNQSWVDCKENMELNKQRDEMRAECMAIRSDFKNLKIKLKKLLDENEVANKNSRLPVQIFDLDTNYREEKIKLNNLEQVKRKEYFIEQIFCQDNVSHYIKVRFWDPLSVPGCTLISLDGGARVDNYALPAVFEQVDVKDEQEVDDEEVQDFKSCEKFSGGLATGVSNETNEIATHISTGKIAAKYTVDTRDNEEDKDEKLALTGTTFYRWIQDDMDCIVNQISRCGSYDEGVKMNIYSSIREKKLKTYFNSLFENMRIAKEEKIKLANDQIARINHCSSELKEMFQLNYPVDFNWLHLVLHDSERPLTVVNVEDVDVYKSFGDFIDTKNSDSMNYSMSLNESTTLDTAFREDALQRMMGGVLEVRWEDEIKKNVAVPMCLSKNPDGYKEEDLIAIRDYEKEMAKLNEKKLKYKLILENEIIEIQNTLRENIFEFNRNVEMFFLKRMKIESAILQESLLRIQELRRRQLRCQGINEILRLKNTELILAQCELQKLIDDLPLLESAVLDTKNRYENLGKREKLLEGKFRGEFSDLKQPMVEHLLRHYKKRPRIGQLMCTSIIYLTELSRCILSGEKSEILPRDCLDFLKGMNILDVMPSGLPTQIDSNHWFLLCKLRRNKVEIETRVKCTAVELAEAEQTLSIHQKFVQNTQNKIQQLKESIDSTQNKNTEISNDMEIQLALKMGQIETNLCGHPREFNNSILVTFNQVLNVNNAIVEAGRKKLKAMNQTIIFRRSIQWKEWCHSCLNMTLKDMKEELTVLQDVKVTKEIQKYLMCNLHIGGSEKDMEAWERSIMSSKKRFIRMLEDEKYHLVDVAKRLNSWQMKNNHLGVAIEKIKLLSFKVSLQANDEKRTRDERYRCGKLKAIMKRNRLITKVQNNYEDLLALRSQLELLRLKTYPTLRLKDSNSEKKHRKKN